MEQGSHDDLLNVEDGVYKNLVQMQSHRLEEGTEKFPIILLIPSF